LCLTYAVIPNDDFTRYTFHTDNKITYYIYFTSYLFRDERGEDFYVPSFNFDCIDPVVRPVKDEKVKHTILQFIHRYFEDNPDIGALYVCDSSDHREAARKRVFQRWYNEFGADHPNLFEKHEFSQETEWQNVYAAFIIRTDNPLRDYYVTSFKTTAALAVRELVK
jgi:hypothetical protein